MIDIIYNPYIIAPLILFIAISAILYFTIIRLEKYISANKKIIEETSTIHRNVDRYVSKTRPSTGGQKLKEELKDFIYVDKRRVESFYSQLNRGLDIQQIASIFHSTSGRQFASTQVAQVASKNKKKSESRKEDKDINVTYSIIDDFLIDKVEEDIENCIMIIDSLSKLEKLSKRNLLVNITGYLSFRNFDVTTNYLVDHLKKQFEQLKRQDSPEFRSLIDNIEREIIQSANIHESRELEFSINNILGDNIVAVGRFDPINLRITEENLKTTFQGNKMLPLNFVGTILSFNEGEESLVQITNHFRQISDKLKTKQQKNINDFYEWMDIMKNMFVALSRGPQGFITINPLYVYQSIHLQNQSSENLQNK
ncbi:MAG: hypothetical protein IID61_06195 [SAR324 cluster bacterium]|nr:hypothetical protein [SAR324 cluster bacterium]